MDSNGSILLIDPNDVNSNPNIVNSVPDYENMFIFVELTAERRGRSVLVTSGDGSFSTMKTGLEDNVFINMLGFDKNKQAFTTNTYNGSIPDDQIQYEGFGMSNIKVVINSSYIPQVSIEFIDIRGVSFFERENSPYRLLFDFPPPIFNLTIKGYYGKSLTYKLHLVKYNTNFDASSGNFIINTDFIAMTFAPLTDVLFKYIVNFGKIRPEAITANPTEKPKSTYELITKIGNLFDDLNKKVNVLKENTNFETAVKKVNDSSKFFNSVKNFKNDDNISIPESYRKDNSLVFLIYDPTESNGHGQGTYTEINDISMYDTYLKTAQDQSINNNTQKKLILGIKILKNNTTEQIITLNNQKVLQIKTDIINSINNILKTVKKNLIDSTNSLVTVNNNDITDPSNIPLDGNVYTNDNQYVGIDISSLYQKVYKQTQQFLKDKSDSQNQLLTKVNQIIESQLGMKPTIYNIFKIICNDIDYFFQTIRDTTIAAENHHEKNKNLILNNGDIRDNKEKIYAFPYFIKKIFDKCGSPTETRMYPLDVSNQLGAGNEFPELLLVNKFIQSFLEIQKDNLVKDMRIKEDAQGNLKWIPISPFDSRFGTTNSQKNSPYFSVENGGGNVNNILNILLKRYYVLSQEIYGDKFYENKQDLIEFFAKGEAINLASSLKNKTLIDNLLIQTQRFSNTQFFYGYISTTQNDLYNFNDNNINLDGINYSVDKFNDNYEPITILSYDENVKIRVDGEDNDTIVGKYMKSLKPTFLGIFTKPSGKYNNFTTENLVIINDLNNAIPSNNKAAYISRYVINPALPSISDDHNSFTYCWSFFLSQNDKLFFTIINDSLLKDLSILLISSNFGSTLSPFSTIDSSINKNSDSKDNSLKIFLTSAIIEVPFYLIIYVASIIRLIKSKNAINISDKKFYNDYIEYKTKYPNSFPNTFGGKILIDNDINDFEEFFPLKGKNADAFINVYNTFISSGNAYDDLTNSLNAMYNEILTNKITSFDNKKTFYNNTLTTTYVEPITNVLIKKNVITNYNQITFSKKNNVGNSYISLNTIVTTPSDPGDKKKATDNYFKIFFQKLNEELQTQKTNIKNIENEFKKSIDDDDIWNQMYYSFKNISDKWISGINKNINGYPFNDNNKNLIDKFAFVDRAMNPIGDVVINPEELLEMYNDVDINVFTVMSRLLSKNGFEFFPLQNFMSFNSNNPWEKTFKIFDTNDSISQENVDAFYVCMYIGGTSNYLTTSGNGFINDGIVDLGNENLSDFNNNGCEQVLNTTNTDDNQEKDKNDSDLKFPYRQVRAFRVRFGQQNQSYFKNIKIDSKEYPETNESLAILSRIAGDNKKQSPIPKGQNLYNVYENRSYKAQIEMLGNMMIQPTQYFQLENIPMYNGAYMILDVEHNIGSNNYMTTKFNGVKILKYPIPLNRQSATIAGINGGSTDETNGNISSNNVIVAALTPGALPIDAQYNAMFELLI
jgi:hypothetical protein